MPLRRFLPSILCALFVALTFFSSTAFAADDPAKTAAMVKDVADAEARATTVGHKYADIAWMLVATALVMLMMPGLALFYGGMARRKNLLGTMMHTMVALGLVGVQWVVIGYSLAFGAPLFKFSISETDVEKKDESGAVVMGSDGKPEMVKAPIEAGIVGYSPELVCLGVNAAVGTSKTQTDVLKDMGVDPKKATDEQKTKADETISKLNQFKSFPNTNIPLYLHAMFQGMFAIITVALISGAFAERVKFISYLLFALIWTTVVYDPLAHMVWSFDWSESSKVAVALTGDEKATPPVPPTKIFPAAGLFGANGAIDFAGGTVVHIAAGFSGLAAILLLRKRIGYGKQTFHPNSMVLTLLGAGLLWFGWFGFNGGSALYSNPQAVSAFTVTQVAAAMAAMAWTIVEWIHRGKPTALGFASGLVAGLVAITPASGFVAPGGALAIGAIAGVVCYAAVALKSLLGYDDSLDAFGVHGVGGFAGAILTAVFVSLPLWIYGSEMPPASFPGKTNIVDGVVVYDQSAQIMWQLKAAAFSAIYAFLATAIIIVLIDKTIGFTVKAEDEQTGLDLTQHGEVAFDFGQIEEETFGPDPVAAASPSGGKVERFTVVIDGADSKKLHKAWADMCKPSEGDKKPKPEFTEVYKYLTTISGNKFRFRGGDPAEIKRFLGKLFEDALNQSGIQTHVEH